MCHPDPFVDEMEPLVTEQKSAPVVRPTQEKFRNSTEAVAVDAIAKELERLGVAADRLTSDERLRIIAALDEGGIFLFKGAVKDVAAELHCSQASVYRYLSQIRGTTEEPI